MKKAFKSYVLIWTILLVMYNVIIFAARPLINYDARFWIAWGAIIVAFLGQLLCANIAFDAKNKEKFFLNLSLINESYAALITLAVVGSVLMLIPDFPAWLTVIICVVILGFSAIAIIAAKTAADLVGKIDDKIKVQTFFIKSMTVDADELMARAQTEEIKEECKKVYEAVRYSDPMSSDVLAGEESQITLKFNEFAAAVNTNDADAVKALAQEVTILLDNRNKKCKLLK